MVSAFRRPAAGIDGGQFARLGIPVNGEKIAADAVAFRFHYAERGVGRDGRIHGGAAARQHLRSGLRREGLAGGYDAARRR